MRFEPAGALVDIGAAARTTRRRLPVREAESAQALIDTGRDAIACHVDSPKVVIETAEPWGWRLFRLSLF
jgi:hypothetical protein